jgi:hypothetical protein
MSDSCEAPLTSAKFKDSFFSNIPPSLVNWYTIRCLLVARACFLDHICGHNPGVPKIMSEKLSPALRLGMDRYVKYDITVVRRFVNQCSTGRAMTVLGVIGEESSQRGGEDVFGFWISRWRNVHAGREHELLKA